VFLRIIGDDDDSDIRHVSLCPTTRQKKVQLPVGIETGGRLQVADEALIRSQQIVPVSYTHLDVYKRQGLVLAGRGYNIYDRGVNCDIPRKLRQRYGANVIPLDFLVTGREAIDPATNMFWVSGRKILEAARIAASRPNLHMVYITNFKCGPDSYIKHFAREAAGAPLLILQFDGHGNDAGYMTRCEAYLDSKGILRCYQPPKEPLPKTLAATIH